LPASANAEVLLNQIDETSPESINSQNFNPSNDAFDAMAADDFVVPAGETWTIDSALVRGSNDGSVAATSVDVKIFADAGGLPGAEVYGGSASATDYPRMQLSFAGPTLSAGTYWFGVSAVLDPGTTPPFHQWYWAENSEPFGHPAVYRNPGDGFQTGCTTFTVKSTCAFNGVPHVAPSQSFSLSGTRTLPPVEDGGCEKAEAKLKKAKAKLKKAKVKAADAEGRAKDAAKEKVKKAKAKVRKAKAGAKEACA
jgi:hypothetical protein